MIDRGIELLRPAGSTSSCGTRGRRSPSPSACWRSPWSSSARCSAASSSPRSTPAPSRWPSGPPAARGSRSPNERIAEVEEFLRKQIPEHDLELIISELGVTPDWSAAYTPNAGPMDAIVQVQLAEHREPLGPGVRRACSATAFASEPRFADLEFAFDAGGLIRGA